MSARVETMTVPGNLPRDLNPLPKFRREYGFSLPELKGDHPKEYNEGLGAHARVMPYKMQDRYSRARDEVTLKTVVLENKYLKATFTPELGGKLWSLFDKINNRELLLNNPVLQPGNLGLRNAWTSGGIEWNFGVLGHTYFTCDNVYAALLEAPDGNSVLRMYEFERAKECVWQADFLLPEESKVLICHISLYNPGSDTTTYWWSNAAIPDDNHTRVLSSSEQVIAICGNSFTAETLPELSGMHGDMSYPDNSTRAFDYFFQPEAGTQPETTWEAAVNNEGYTFFDRSTAPLIYHKLFCWGSHRAGKRWQEYLSEGRKGDYIELQAGIARTQLHDKLFPAGAKFEWTQCFGGTKVDRDEVHGKELHEANKFMEARVEELVSEREILGVNRILSKIATLPVGEKQIVHRGAGWGALELQREAVCRDKRLPLSVTFPESSLCEEQKPWQTLLETGILPETSPDIAPVSFMVSPAWQKLLEAGFGKEGGRNWLSLYHYGNMLFEAWDDAHLAAETVNWPDSEKYIQLAEAAWKESAALTPNVWALRNLALLEHLRGNTGAALAYYDRVFELPASLSDFAFAAEYLGWLADLGQYSKAWALFSRLPESIRRADRVVINAARSALRVGQVDFVESLFGTEYAAIREGETSLTDMWFELSARKLAANDGISSPSSSDLAKYKALALKNCPPPAEIDFRMSYDENSQYRKTE